MKETTKEKLDVLNRVGKLDKESFSFITEVDKYLESNYNSTDNEMLLIHLSVAINRMNDKEVVDKLPDDVWEQIVAKDEYQEATLIWKHLSPMAPVEFSIDETQYILLHILNILRRD